MFDEKTVGKNYQLYYIAYFMIKKLANFSFCAEKTFLDEKPDAYFIAEVYLFMMLGGLPTKTN